jgi:hypothetical protein
MPMQVIAILFQSKSRQNTAFTGRFYATPEQFVSFPFRDISAPCHAKLTVHIRGEAIHRLHRVSLFRSMSALSLALA